MIYIRQIPVIVKHFPNGEVQISGNQPALDKLHALNPDLTATFRFHWESDADFIVLKFVKRYFDAHIRVRTHLCIDYMPYSRMDRQTGDIFTLKYLCDDINDLGFDTITVQEPHSDVTLALLNNSRADYPSSDWLLTRAMRTVGFDIMHDYLFFPDAGAQKRYHNLDHYKSMVGLKSRGVDGRIANDYQIVGPTYLHPDTNNIIIVDDLCSYGGTFLKAAEAFQREYEDDVRRIYLVVTHLEDSVYRGELLDSGLIQGIFATDTLQPAPKHKLVKLHDIYLHHAIAMKEEE